MLTLVVSGLEKKFIKKDDKLLLAGNWLQNENNINEEVYENNIFISDEKEIKSFTTNISNIHEKIVNKLHIELNKVHNVNFDLRMWKVLIDPWITYYLENIYFRWKIIKDILENDKKNGIKFLNFDKIVYSAPFDQNEFHHLIASSSTFNHFIFQKILIYFSKTNNQLIAENINQKVPLSANYNYTINCFDKLANFPQLGINQYFNNDNLSLFPHWRKFKIAGLQLDQGNKIMIRYSKTVNSMGYNVGGFKIITPASG